MGNQEAVKLITYVSSRGGVWYNTNDISILETIYIYGLHRRCHDEANHTIFYCKEISAQLISFLFGGEKTLINLLDALKNKISIKDKILGISYKKIGKIIRNSDQAPLSTAELDSLPPPLYKLIPNNFYQVLPVESSRGCLYNCNFCGIYFKHKWRPFSIQKIIKNVFNAQKFFCKVKSNRIFFTDDCFTPDKKRVIEICEHFKDKQIAFGIEARVRDILNEDIIKALNKLDIYFVQMGIECGYNNGLKLVGKSLTTEEIIKCAENLAHTHFAKNMIYSYVIGFPWEKLENMLATINFAYALTNRFGGTVQIARLLVLPGSKLWLNRKQHKIITKENCFDDIYLKWIDKFIYSSKLTFQKQDMKKIASYLDLMSILFPSVLCRHPFNNLKDRLNNNYDKVYIKEEKTLFSLEELFNNLDYKEV